ncbi:UvrD-helicase domain-containing protein [Allofrancisella guangzhouensis]|uniref:ATP-dependent DNA helicase Rep n=1 Tax=Allofrancisella guangzhouensis TaxID=594679 RepID=A0A0A8EA14_9GAMM|nr:UvrD-helicase domain-containing protein [Allofrancisella guangzhouensis]AJC49001.1 ATP-dependent DNA helicase Rep [Allofrancisella guangzhouensis]MBK2027906.1 UvrD-helicase domain-containing protein [Allofrancisella guangzhouensis]MBK2044159.1 UvrD-helicase domain-containing protein [Allofrancisella guangzhouensis]MBK2045139.1 UvrD-helicase domain-containing protein [Allofrancisella guangzhouensis]
MLDNLNLQQQQAVKYIGSPLLVLAGAGSGKTSVIIEKISYLIEQLLYPARSILAVTFTNKAAKEMQERVKARLNKDLSKGLMISTFHSLGLSILKKHYADLEYKKSFTLFDSADSLALIYDIAYEQYQLPKQHAGIIQTKISFWKSALLMPEQVEPKDDLEQQAAFIYKEYQKYLKSYNSFDFDDLIFQPIQLFRINPNIQKLWTDKFRYILIDEYQDTNESQYQLLKCLTQGKNKFTVVGDDDQSIYAWRGSRPENLRHLQEDFPDLKVIKLEQNYRSTGRILNVANKLIENNSHIFEKKLWSAKGYGDQVKVISLLNDEDEAQFIASDIFFDRIKTNSKNSDYAILIRSNYQAFILERYMQMHKIPYAISGGTSFFSKSEIKDIVSYLRLIVNPDDDRAFLRVINTPKREIGSVTIHKLGEYASFHHCSFFHTLYNLDIIELRDYAKANLNKFKDLIVFTQQEIVASISTVELKKILGEFVERISYRQWLIDSSSSEKQAEFRYANVLEVIRWIINQLEDEAYNGLDSLSSVLNKMLLIDILDRDNEEKNDDQVQIITMHASKGLEFKKVYIMGMEDGILPHQQSIEEESIEDERRLAYVAITRAKENLTITLTKHRKKFGEKIVTVPSRFIEELPETDLYWVGSEKECPETRKENSKQNLSALKNMFG